MQEGNEQDEPTLYSATLAPYRSLGRLGFIVLMAVLAGASFAAGIAFLLIGAWPVFGFLGLDVLLVYLAFRANYRAARAFEEIRVTPNQLLVRQVSARGQAREERFNPRWVRLETSRDELSGVTRVALVSKGVPLVIGSFLPPLHKEELSNALAGALAAGPALRRNRVARAGADLISTVHANHARHRHPALLAAQDRRRGLRDRAAGDRLCLGAFPRPARSRSDRARGRKKSRGADGTVPPLVRPHAQGVPSGGDARPCAEGLARDAERSWKPASSSAFPGRAGCTICSWCTRPCRRANGRPAARA